MRGNILERLFWLQISMVSSREVVYVEEARATIELVVKLLHKELE